MPQLLQLAFRRVVLLFLDILQPFVGHVDSSKLRLLGTRQWTERRCSPPENFPDMGLVKGSTVAAAGFGRRRRSRAGEKESIRGRQLEDSRPR